MRIEYITQALMDYFKDLLELLQLELTYDRQQHQSLLLERGVNARKSLGVSWYPIQITNSELGRGDYLTLTIHKTTDLENSHKFRFGMPVSLFSNHNPHEDRISGTIAFVSQYLMRVSFRTDDLPEWSRKGKLGIDLLFDENSYREMTGALVEAESRAIDKDNGQLIRQLIGIEPLRVGSQNTFYENTALNLSQNSAVRQVLAEGPLTILHGPPGTGKTTTLISAIYELIQRTGQQVLVVAPSNTAVDVLSERLDLIGLNVLRIGNPVKISDHLMELTLDEKANKHPAYREVKVLGKQARAYTDMAHKYKRNFGRSEYEQRKALLNEARKIRKEIDRIQDYVTEDILNKAQVITATLVGANNPYIKDRYYKTVIIDEAAQALEPACWIPILKADHLILAGDHCQLPPTVKSSQGRSNALFHTLFEKLIKLYPEAVSFLDTQYRMNGQIMAYPSTVLYRGMLKAAPSVSQWTLQGDSQPIIFIDTAGAGYEESEADDTLLNREEALFLKSHLSELLSQCRDLHRDAVLPDVGVITPYRGQATLLKDMLAEINNKDFGSLQITTIDGFQGQEKDIIYISLVRSNSDQAIGFLSDIRRMNVALTRARKKIVVIGDSATIGAHPFYKGFLTYVESVGGYHSVWEWGSL